MTTSEIKGPLTILGMEVENVKRVSVVRLKPDGSVIQITGENEAGKSSVLDAIWMALDWAHSVKPPQPIRKGAEEGIIKLDMGEIKVTRTFRRRDGDPPYTTSLKIEAASGARFNSPQTLLDGLIGSLSFEPLEFMKRDDKGKFDALKSFVQGVDFDAIDGQNKSDYEARTDENRKAKELAAQAAGIMVPDGKFERIDVTQVVADLEAAELHNSTLAQRVQRRQAVEDEAGRLEAEAKRIDERIEEAKRLIESLTAQRTEVGNTIVSHRDKLATAEPLPSEIDTAALRAKITEAQTVNANADKAERKAQLLAQATHHKAASDALSAAMEARSEAVRAAIANAKMPVPGLSLADGKVFLDGLPLEQASTAQKLKLSIGVAMAVNPTIRIIRITEGGNDLDKTSMGVLYKMAEEHGYQVFIERVSALGGPASLIMEDGHAKA